MSLSLSMNNHLGLFTTQDHRLVQKLQKTLPMFRVRTLVGIRISIRQLFSDGPMYLQPILGLETTDYPVHCSSFTREIVMRCTAAMELDEAWCALRNIEVFDVALSIMHTFSAAEP